LTEAEEVSINAEVAALLNPTGFVGEENELEPSNQEEDYPEVEN
jgi:hypothetical protein